MQFYYFPFIWFRATQINPYLALCHMYVGVSAHVCLWFAPWACRSFFAIIYTEIFQIEKRVTD